MWGEIGEGVKVIEGSIPIDSMKGNVCASVSFRFLFRSRFFSLHEEKEKEKRRIKIKRKERGKKKKERETENREKHTLLAVHQLEVEEGSG